jgi:distribution and morphology protein 34
MTATSEAGESVELASQADSTWSTWGGDRMGGSTYSGGAHSRSPSLRRMRSPGTSPPMPSHDMLDSVPESIEHYDPTYGLRPDALPHHAGFADYERLAARSGSRARGLGDVLEVDDEEGEEDPFHSPRQHVGDGSFDFDMIGLNDLVDDGHQYPLPRTSFDSMDVEPDAGDYETIPAVGGGTVTRPRVFHTQSQMRMRTASTGSLSAHGSPSTATARSAAGGSAASTVGLGKLNSLSKVSALDGRAEYFAAPSVASTPRFPFPKYGAPPAYSAKASAPSLARNTHSPTFPPTRRPLALTPSIALPTPPNSPHRASLPSSGALPSSGRRTAPPTPPLPPPSPRPP